MNVAARAQALQDLWHERLHTALGMEYLSVSALQRRLRMNHADACLLLDALQALGAVEVVQVFAVKHTLGDWRARMSGLDDVKPCAIGQERGALEHGFRQAVLADVLQRLQGDSDGA